MTVYVLSRLALEDLDAAYEVLPVVHSWPVPPFRIYYVREPDRLVVLRIYHHARQPLERG